MEACLRPVGCVMRSTVHHAHAHVVGNRSKEHQPSGTLFLLRRQRSRHTAGRTEQTTGRRKEKEAKRQTPAHRDKEWTIALPMVIVRFAKLTGMRPK